MAVRSCKPSMKPFEDGATGVALAGPLVPATIYCRACKRLCAAIASSPSVCPGVTAIARR